MHRDLPLELTSDISESIKTAFRDRGAVDIAVLAEQVRSRNVALNIALEDIEWAIVKAGQLLKIPMAFETRVRAEPTA